MRFQERDGLIIFTIDDYGGVLAKRHLQDRFWPTATERAMLKRLEPLVKEGYLCRPTSRQWREHPIPEAVYWIGLRGILWLAAQRGIVVDPPKNLGENQLRGFQKRLREQGLRWRREPSWFNLRHDLRVLDCRFHLERSADELPSITIEQFIKERDFRAAHDKVTINIRDKSGQVDQVEREVVPDGGFILSDERRRQQGLPHRFPALLEMDLATHDNPSFAREKVAASLAYLKSPTYKARFGLTTSAGAWLIVTTGKRRRENLMKHTQDIAGSEAQLFFFVCFDDLAQAENSLTEAIWYQVGKTEPRSLLLV